jgi:hypothetical protein
MNERSGYLTSAHRAHHRHHASLWIRALDSRIKLRLHVLQTLADGVVLLNSLLQLLG